METADVTTEIENTEAADAATESESAETYSFQDLSKYSFEFCSGAGAWATDFTIADDGSFSGLYHDSDMGDIGEGYEHGTLYYSAFSGHFSELTPVDEYTCEMTLSDISYENEPDTEEIINQLRYRYSDAYGLTGTTKFLVYFPGTPVSTFDEEIYSWIQWSIEDGSDVLTRPVIVNVDQEEGIYSYES
jgi:hypothetical protein